MQKDKENKQKPKILTSINKLGNNPFLFTIYEELNVLGVHIIDSPKLRQGEFEIDEYNGIAILFLNTKMLLSKEINERIDDFFLDYPAGQIIMNYSGKLTLNDSMKIDDMLISQLLDKGKGTIPIINSKHAALSIYSLAKRVQIRDEPPTIARTKPKFKSILDIQKFFIEGLSLCGPKKATQLIDSNNFSSPLDLIQTIIDSEILYTKTGNPKGFVEGDKMNIKGFGPKFVLKNKELLTK